MLPEPTIATVGLGHLMVKLTFCFPTFGPGMPRGHAIILGAHSNSVELDGLDQQQLRPAKLRESEC